MKSDIVKVFLFFAESPLTPYGPYEAMTPMIPIISYDAIVCMM